MDNVRNLLNRYGTILLLGVMVVAGLYLRFYNLGFQSLWLDEIYTAIESDPAYREHQLSYYLHNIDQQPPLFFLLERISIFLFGNNETSLRIIPALAGTGSILGMYLVGREVHSKPVGLYAALFIAVNAFGIYYSNEARPYALALFFSLLSWYYFLKFTRTLSIRDGLSYAVVTLLTLYSSYFAMLVVGAQVLIAVVLWIDASNKRKFALRLGSAGALIAAGFTPLITFLKSISKITTFWAAKPAEDIGISYFFEYFGESDLLKPFLLMLLVCFLVRLIFELREERLKDGIRAKPMTFLFTICSIWIFVCLFIPFLRSYLAVPMMVARYTILVMPAYMLFIACGLDYIMSRTVQALVVTIFVLLSITHLVVVREYYHRQLKTQFKELAKYMSLDQSLMYPVVTHTTAWQQQYYLRRHHFRSPVFNDHGGATIDSLANLGLPFWLTSAHAAKPANKAIYQRLDSSYMIAKDIHLFDAWGKLFVPRNFLGDSGMLVNGYSYPAERSYVENEAEQFIALWWTQRLDLDPVKLKAGNYRCIVVAKGTPADGIYPHLTCLVNHKKLGAYYLSSSPRDTRAFDFTLDKDTLTTLSILYDNDATSNERSEDRNAYIYTVFVRIQPGEQTRSTQARNN
jgi:mannosyltransferase